jgi:DNA recombination-dependent growth factor C
MPALSGSLSYQRFFVDAVLLRDAWPGKAGQPWSAARSHDAILAHAMRPLDPKEPDAERSGWCVMGDPMDLALDRSRVYLDGFLNLGLRTDRWAIPSALFKTRVREVEAQEKVRRERERLGRREKAEIKELVTRELRKKLLPSIRAVDLSWSLEENVVRFFTHSKKTTDVMLDLFQKTFGVALVAESPYSLGERIGFSDAQLQAWEALEPTSLFLESKSTEPAQATQKKGAR